MQGDAGCWGDSMDVAGGVDDSWLFWMTVAVTLNDVQPRS